MLTTKRILLFLTLALGLFIQITNANSTTKPITNQTTTPPPFPNSVITQMATRQMRYHHFLWHQIRDNWNRFSNATQQAFQQIGWAPPNPSRDSNGNLIKNNLCGEEFLYMHRDMIATVNQIIAQNKDPYGPIVGWTTIPAPGDPLYPVPPPYQKGTDNQSLASYKTDDFYNKSIKAIEISLKDPVALAKMSLNDLGVKIESGIHNNMHNRWSNFSVLGYRSGGIGTGVPNVAKKWDDPKYDWLVDTYSSHVNPVFWKLHGWIDDRVEDWRKAHKLDAIKWNSTWIGGPMSNLSSVMKQGMMHVGSQEDPEAVGDILEKAMEIFQSSGVPEWDPATDPLSNAEEDSDEKSIISNDGASSDPKLILGGSVLVISALGIVFMIALLF